MPLAVCLIFLLFTASSATAEDHERVHALRLLLRREQLNILRAVRSCLELPYRLGGTYPEEGMDCSGFVYWVYRTSGYPMPRSTAEQARFRKHKARLAPGDVLVFRGNGASGYHTGIYVAPGWFAHAPGRGKGVMYSRFDPSGHDFLGAWSPIVALRHESPRWRKIALAMTETK
ncbi:MAG: C40 family peptidase [Desulfovibrio sp.]|nr:C40 family peptidase [Desulfovibrio sp.]